MKIKIISLFVIMFIQIQISGQVLKYARLIIGTESSGYISVPAKTGGTDEFPSIQWYSFIPHIDIRIFKHLYLGASYEYSFGKFEKGKLPNYKSIGLQMKYFVNPLKSKFFFNRFLFSTELAYRKANYFLDDNEQFGVGILDGFTNRFIDFIIATNFNLFDNVYLNFGYRIIYYNYNDKIQTGPKLGIQYHFGEKRGKKIKIININKFFNVKTKRKTKRIKMNPYLKFSDRFIYSSSITYIPQEGYYKDLVYHEFTWYNSFSVNINKSIFIGLQYLAIYSSGSIIHSDNTKNTYRIYGLKLQYDLLPRYEDRLFLETSINKGNYCTCGDLDPYKAPNLIYIGLGFGYDYPIIRRLSLKVGFTNYTIISKIKDKYNYTQYLLGVNLNFGKPYNRDYIKLHDLL